MYTLEISKKLFERYEKNHRVFHYFGLLALYALSQTAYEANDNKMMKKCKDMLSLYPDNFDHPNYNFENYKVGGNGKAWLLYKGLFEEERENIAEYAERTLKAPVDENGILCMPSDSKKQKIWIDVVTAVTPFMLYAGLYFNEEKYIDFAAEQCFKMYEMFLDKTCGLLHQSKGFMENPDFVSHDHWSRGNGWGYIGLADLVANLPKNSKHRKKAEKYFVDLSKSLISFQTQKGVWRQEITADYAWDESSGTGLIAYGLGVGLRTGLLDKDTFEKPFINAINGIVNYFINDDFSTNMCSGGCLCPGSGKDKGTINAYLTQIWPLKDEPHSYGSLMLAMVEAHRNGIVKVEKTIHR
jgi:unsaturated rhamnogalacturonyl hydrolase